MTVVRWTDGMRFVGVGASNHEVAMDAAEAGGGRNSAARPVETLLCSLGACTGMDVLSILRKMKTEPAALRIEIDDERASDFPQIIQRIRLTYVVRGNIPEDNLRKAIDLSLAKYCPIANTLAGVSEITYELLVESD